MSDQRTNEGQGFSILGAADRRGSHRREERPARSPPRRRPSVDERDAPRGGWDARRRRDDDRHYRPSRDWDPRDTTYHRRGEAHAPFFSSGEGYSDPTYYNEPPEEPAANGDLDVETEESQFRQVLLIRDLKTNVDENTLATGLNKLYLDDSQPPPPAMPMPPPPGMPPRPPTLLGATPRSLKRVFVIRDRVTDRSLGFGFAEYHSPTDAKAALAKAKQLGTSCTISSKQITVCHPHLGVFDFPLTHSLEEQRYLFDFNGQLFRYRDTRYYASPFEVNAEAPAAPQSSSPAKEAPVTMTKPKKRTKTEAMGTLDNPTEPTKKAKKESAMVTMLNRAQAQARGENGEAETTNDPNSNPHSPSGANHDSSTTGTGREQSFAFDGKLNGKYLTCCLLCNAKFPSREKLVLHVQIHPPHAEKYKDEKTFNDGLERMKKRGIGEDETIKVEMTRKDDGGAKKQGEQEPATTEYRDRAAERREEEAKARAASSKPLSFKVNPKSKGGNQPNKRKSPSPDPPAPAPMGIGMRMLQNAGWQTGQGLGSGGGITAPIEQSVYAAGVGLGHQDSKKGDAVEEADRATRNDRVDFVAKTKDAARKRYEGMQ